jgi:PhnB protein
MAVSLFINFNGNCMDMELIESLFNKLREGGTVTMELQETFWSKKYGMLVDKFGIPWMISYDSGYVVS